MPNLGRIPFALLIPVLALGTLAFPHGSAEPPPEAESATLTWRPLHSHGGEGRGPSGLGVVITGITTDGSRILATAPMQSFRSDDRGATWTEIPGIRGVRDVALRPDGLVLLGGAGGVIRRSTDAGASWTEIRTVADGLLIAILIDGDRAFAAGDHALLRSLDAGATWKRVDAPRVNYEDLAMRGSIVIAVGGAGLVARSTDGGESWSSEWLPAEAMLTGVAFADDRTVVIATSDGTLLRSTDAGATWHEVGSPALSNLTGIAFGEDGHGVAVGFWGEAIRTTDEGATWMRERSGTRLHLVNVKPDPAGGFLVSGFRETVFSVTGGGAR